VKSQLSEIDERSVSNDSSLKGSATIVVSFDDLSSPEVQALVAAHLADMHAVSPPENVHAMAIEGLQRPDVTFWSARIQGQLCGCGALKVLSDTAGEIKSMRTHPEHLRRGVAQAVLDEIIRVAKGRGYTYLFLETGSGAAFEAAHALYLRNGFERTGAFGDYVASGFNVFMVKILR